MAALDVGTASSAPKPSITETPVVQAPEPEAQNVDLPEAELVGDLDSREEEAMVALGTMSASTSTAMTVIAPSQLPSSSMGIEVYKEPVKENMELAHLVADPLVTDEAITSALKQYNQLGKNLEVSSRILCLLSQ